MAEYDGLESTLLSVLQQLTESLPNDFDDEDKEADGLPGFPVSRFFTTWFRKRGKIYSFVFKKNHRVTNIQIAELIALLRTYRMDSSNELAFVSPQDFRGVIKDIVDTFYNTSSDIAGSNKFMERHYGAMLNNIAVLDALYGSCVVFLPPGVEIDVASVCALSGYIHSYGPNIYIRNIYKSSKDRFFARLDNYLSDPIRQGRKILFRPYSHEDFTENDTNYRSALKSGLDDVKILAQKSFLGNERIADIVEQMRDRYSGKLVIPFPGDSSTDARFIGEQRADPFFDSDHCLFLIIDHSIEPGPASARGNRHFIICYDQQNINSNPFHLFDENKPAWFDHTTLPHTLAGAMINISRPFWPKKKHDDPIRLCDCFVGSGTTLFEIRKFDGVQCTGLDYEPISKLLVRDNATIFSESSDHLHNYVQRLSSLCKYLSIPEPTKRTDIEKWSAEKAVLETANQLCAVWKEAHRQRMSPESTDELVRRSEETDVFGRLAFYTRLKVERRYESALAACSVDPKEVLKKELDDLSNMLSELAELRIRVDQTNSAETIHRYIDVYSSGLSLSMQRLQESKRDLDSSVRIVSCEEWVPECKYDVIVSDPPYGFNTQEDTQHLAVVYASFLKKAIGALADDGQLIIALPDWSHTGRRLPAFVLKDFVINQVLMIANACEREVIIPASPSPRAVGAAPYYWESEKALKRAILHFLFRPLRRYFRGSPQGVDS